jgi:D-sedoheptulose 7-phosphate isomerase
MSRGPLPCGQAHLDQLRGVLDALGERADLLDGWGRALADVLVRGGRLLAVGNGGSAAEAQHLTAEIVGRYRDDRPPFSAIALHAETSAMTAIGNDYGIDEVFARQVRAHGRPGDVLLALSTSGTSPNVVAAAEAGVATGLRVWALTGPVGSPLCRIAEEAVCVDTPHTATIQEAHLVAIHMLCASFDCALGDMGVMDAPRGSRFEPSSGRVEGSRL